MTTPPRYFPERDHVRKVLLNASPGDVVFLAQQALLYGLPEVAFVVCEVAEGLGLHDPSIGVVAAISHARCGDTEAAVKRAEALREAHPGHLATTWGLGYLLTQQDPVRSRQLLAEVCATWADFPGAHENLADVTMPGPPYRAVLTAIHGLLAPKTYLEIGVFRGATLALAQDAKLAVGVDPHPQLSGPLPPNYRIYAMTSDDFFARETPGSVFGGATVDLAFIDGMHLFEFALRDFIHVERWSSPQSTIVLHDCLPVTPEVADRARRTVFWPGDVWKLLECLLEHRSDLKISVAPTSPSGLVIIRRLDPASKLLEERMDQLVAQYHSRDYPYPASTWPAHYPFVTVTGAGLAAALS